MKKLVIAIGVAALALSVGGCSKTPAQKEVDKQADAIGDSYKADADVQRSLASGAPDQKAQDQAADQTEQKGKAIEKHLKNEADELGKDAKQTGDGTK